MPITPFSSAVPFNSSLQIFTSYNVAGAVNFTVASGAKIEGAKTIYRLTANGLNEPTFVGFKEFNDSAGYDNRSNILNIIEFTYDGVDNWVTISQEKGALPNFVPVNLIFSSRAGISESVAPEGTLYTASAQAAWSGSMVSAQVIPAGKAGRVTVHCDNASIIGFTTLGTLTTAVPAHTNYDYYAWLGNGPIWTGYKNVAATPTSVLETEKVFIRLARNSNGIVTVEKSKDNITWTSVVTFQNPNTGPLYVAANLSYYGTYKYMRIVKFEIQP
jgi:hypothetical protein